MRISSPGVLLTYNNNHCSGYYCTSEEVLFQGMKLFNSSDFCYVCPCFLIGNTKSLTSYTGNTSIGVVLAKGQTIFDKGKGKLMNWIGKPYHPARTCMSKN